MSEVFYLDVATNAIKTFVDQVRCTVCSTLEGNRVRLSCGHSLCSECAEVAVECVDCLSVLSPISLEFLHDPVLTSRAHKTARLLSEFQDAYNVDVYRRERISNQLKIEKDIFPKCIQAENKYYNKRKTINVKHKKSFSSSPQVFPGEDLSPKHSHKMDRSKNFSHVQQWLDQVEKVQPARLPFADLNVNSPQPHKTKRTTLKSTCGGMSNGLNRITHNIVSKSNSKNDVTKDSGNTWKSAKKVKTEFTKINQVNNIKGTERNKKSFIDQDPIIIEDSQKPEKSTKTPECVNLLHDSIEEVTPHPEDKDRNAWLAVLAADKKLQDTLTSSRKVALECSEVIKYTDEVECIPSSPTEYKKPTQMLTPRSNKTEYYGKVKGSIKKRNVPFYKIGPIFNKNCSKNATKNSLSKSNTISSSGSNNLSLVIETTNYLTTINISSYGNSPTNIIKHSQGIQTDVIPFREFNNDNSQPNSNTGDKQNKEAEEDRAKSVIESESSKDLFTDDVYSAKNYGNKVVLDSESESDIAPATISVVADIHDVYKRQPVVVLSPLDLCTEMKRVCKKRTQRHVASSDSSEKENRDPNRGKKIQLEKKNAKKKNSFIRLFNKKV